MYEMWSIIDEMKVRKDGDVYNNGHGPAKRHSRQWPMKTAL